jgi:GTP cyclohydrolase I
MREKCDPSLGKLVREHLTSLGLEQVIDTPARDPQQARAAMKMGVEGFLAYMGLDLRDPSLQDTPNRVADMYVDELCVGLDYNNFPKCTSTPNGEHAAKTGRQAIPGGPSARGQVDEMVIERNITTISLCEHHFQTITGVTHIAYLPGPKLLGISKLARVAVFFARRPQIQERMTEQIYAALSYILETKDVAVQQVAVHNCIRARGAMDPNSDMITSKMGGRFKENPSTRQEFLDAIGR